MQPEVDTSSGYKCATLRYLVDATRGIDVPIGVALWSAERRWLQFRLPKEGERVEDVTAPAASTYLLQAKAQIEGWLRRDDLPYAKDRPDALSDPWWEHVRRLMRFSVRLGPLQPVDCEQPETEIETLYEALVQPSIPARNRQSRIDGAVRRALGTLAPRFRRGQKVPGYGGRPVRVLRAAGDAQHSVVVEAVNFALKTAEHDADALTSRLSRVRESGAAGDVQFILGYLASPGGLNGELVMKGWVEHQLGARMFDLERESRDFQSETERALLPLADDLRVLAPPR